jgi:PPM family protein phosphatase
VTTLRAGSATDTGLVRRNNQDQLLLDVHLFAVADGMGGHAGGEVASLTAIEALRAAFGDPDDPPRTADDLRSAVRWANRTVYQKSMEDSELRGMGTTMTAVAVVVSEGEDRLAVANVGDSRAYVLVKGELTQLTEDHSVPEELVRAGELTPDDVATHPQRHILTRALGIAPDVEVDLWEILPFVGDRVLLCSDGLCRELSDDQIASALRRLVDPGEAAKELVSRARSAGGGDNITVVVIDVVDDNDRAATASAALAGDVSLAAPPATPPGPSDGDPAAVPPPEAAQPPVAVVRAAPPRRRRVTVAVVIFVVVLGVILGGAAGTVTYYGRGTFYVGLGPGASPQPIVIYQGRPGGLLWFDPTVKAPTPWTTNQVLASRVPDLQRGKVETSVAGAKAYITRLLSEAAASPAAASGRTTIPATSTTVADTLPPLPPLPGVATSAP